MKAPVPHAAFSGDTMTMGRVFVSVVLIALLAAVWLGWLVERGRVTIPERFNPWLPLDVTAPIGPLTQWRYWRATSEPSRCLAALDTSAMSFTPVADTDAKNGCDVHNAVRIARFADVTVNHPFIASCPLALGLAMAEHHVWQSAAETIEGAKLKRIDHVGTYACRNINHASDGTLSEHAHANAIDIEDFVFTDGRRISIADNWGKDSRAGTFLANVHAGACRCFHVVLGPDYNALHHSHFHLDMGPYRTCR